MCDMAFVTAFGTCVFKLYTIDRSLRVGCMGRVRGFSLDACEICVVSGWVLFGGSMLLALVLYRCWGAGCTAAVRVLVRGVQCRVRLRGPVRLVWRCRRSDAAIFLALVCGCAVRFPDPCSSFFACLSVFSYLVGLRNWFLEYQSGAFLALPMVRGFAFRANLALCRASQWCRHLRERFSEGVGLCRSGLVLCGSALQSVVAGCSGALGGLPGC